MTHRLLTEASARILNEITDERRRQEEKWGQQNHADGTGPGELFLGRETHDGTFIDIRDTAIRITDERTEEEELTYADIFLEEVFEALSENDQDRLREELVQCAAVAVKWIEKIDRDKAKKVAAKS